MTNRNGLRTLVVVVLVITVVISAAYALNVSGQTKRLGGTGSVTVSAPTSATIEATPYTFDSSGNITHYRVTWTPVANLNYVVTVILRNGPSTVVTDGETTINGAGTVSRNDDIFLNDAVAPTAYTNVSVVIKQQT